MQSSLDNEILLERIFAKLIGADAYKAGYQVDEERLQQYIEYIVDQGTGDITVEALCNTGGKFEDVAKEYDIKKRMEKLRMKVVIMYGGNELFAAKSVSLVKEKCVSECEVYAYDNMGHSEVLSLHPEKLCEIIRK